MCFLTTILKIEYCSVLKEGSIGPSFQPVHPGEECHRTFPGSLGWPSAPSVTYTPLYVKSLSCISQVSEISSKSTPDHVMSMWMVESRYSHLAIASTTPVLVTFFYDVHTWQAVSLDCGISCQFLHCILSVSTVHIILSPIAKTKTSK